MTRRMTPLGLRATSRRAALLPVVGALVALTLPLGGSAAQAAGRSADGTVPGVAGGPAVGDVGGAPSLSVPAVDLVPGTQWYAGGASESINPTQAMIDTHRFYLGGFGFGSGADVVTGLVPGAPDVYAGRQATGSMSGPYGASSRAMALGDGKHALVTAQIETQGYFLAYKNGDYGIIDIRREAAKQVAALQAAAHTQGVNDLPARSILVDSDHSHTGPDTAGVWGGVPTAPKYTGDLDYLQLVKDRTVKAIVDAWKSLQPVDLFYGDRPAGVNGAAYSYPNEPANFDRLMNNQYDDDPNNQAVDDQVRVLQARKPVTGEPVLTYVNFSAHADVLGSGTRTVSGDYIGPLSAMLAKNGGVGFAQVGTLGREQPARGGDCAPEDLVSPAETNDECRLRQYAARVNKRAQEALAAAQPVTGPKLVAMSSYFLTDAADNAAIYGLDYGGFAVGAPLLRSETPPWTTGNVVGTTMFSGRVGNLVLSGIPGEAYPQILARVPAGLPGKQGYFSIGTAGDFLGYIIYPFGAYPEPIRRSILSGSAPPAGDPSCSVPGQGTPGQGTSVGCPNPIGNDNFFFNISETFGQRLVCAELRGVKANFPENSVDVTGVEPNCQGFTQDAALPAGWETQFSSTGVGSQGAPGPVVPEAPYAVLLVLVALGAGGLIMANARRRAA